MIVVKPPYYTIIREDEPPIHQNDPNFQQFLQQYEEWSNLIPLGPNIVIDEEVTRRIESRHAKISLKKRHYYRKVRRDLQDLTYYEERGIVEEVTKIKRKYNIP